MTQLNQINGNECGYLDLMQKVLESGELKGDRTGVGTVSLFGEQLRFNLRESFPLLTTKKVFFKAVVHELLWMLSGSTDVKPLQEAGISIWDEWATAEQCAKFGRNEGDLGPVYGHQWRNFGATKQHNIDDPPRYEYRNDGVDQFARLLRDLVANPNSRRHIVTGWNPKEADEVALPPCHSFMQFHVMNGRLSCHMYQRSADLFLGVPFNIASYALLTHMVAFHCHLSVGDLIISYGDVHLYKNHLTQAAEQLSRNVRPGPQLLIESSAKALWDFKPEHFQLHEYNPHPAIKAEVAV